MNDVVPLRQSNDPLPTAAYELCPGPCNAGDTCFCDLGMNLVYQGISKIKEKWPTMADGDAALLVAEMLVGNAALQGVVYRGRSTEEIAEAEAQLVEAFASMLIEQAVSLSFECFGSTSADLSVRVKTEIDTRKSIENVLRGRVRDLEWRLRRSRTPASA